MEDNLWPGFNLLGPSEVEEFLPEVLFLLEERGCVRGGCCEDNVPLFSRDFDVCEDWAFFSSLGEFLVDSVAEAQGFSSWEGSGRLWED